MEIENKDVELDSTLDSEIDTDLENDEVQNDSDKDAQIAKLTAIIKRKNLKLGKLQEAGEVKSDKPIIKKTNSKDDSRLERLELKLDGIPDDIIDEILPLGGKEFLKTNIGKRVIDDMLEQRKAEQASEISSGGKSNISKKYSDAELRKMPTAELEKLIREN